jgi:hypothetical protein
MPTRQYKATVLSPLQRSARTRLKNQTRLQQSKVTLPQSARYELIEISERVGISIPALILALPESSTKFTDSQLKNPAVKAALRHGLRVNARREDGTRTRVKVGAYGPRSLP